MAEKKEFKSEQEAIQFLIDDEQEAIEGYEDVIGFLTNDSHDMGNCDEVILTLRKISSEENGHKALLEDMKKKCGLGGNEERKKAMSLFDAEGK